MAEGRYRCGIRDRMTKRIVYKSTWYNAYTLAHDAAEKACARKYGKSNRYEIIDIDEE